MKRICCNKNCGLVWDEGDTLDYKHAVGAHLCPECYEVTELIENPKRIQRKRTKGWRMPENTIYVGRPTIYRNPFKVGCKFWTNSDFLVRIENIEQSMYWYTKWIKQEITRPVVWDVRNDDGDYAPIRKPSPKELDKLRCHNLACWCKEGELCHADVLIELLNKQE